MRGVKARDFLLAMETCDECCDRKAFFQRDVARVVRLEERAVALLRVVPRFRTQGAHRVQV